MTDRTCPSCGAALDPFAADTCPSCGAALRTPSAFAEESVVSSIPFDDTSQPFMQRLIETVKLGLGSPTQMFSNVPADDIGPPILYAVVIGTLASVVGTFYQIVIQSLVASGSGADAQEIFGSTAFMIMFMFLSPLFVLLGIFISSGIFHLMLLLLGGGPRGFNVTLRAVCYGYTPQILVVVPICGGIVGGLWAMVLTIIGAINGHRTDPWRVILAYFLPLIVCCGLFALFFMMIGIAAGVAGQ